MRQFQIVKSGTGWAVAEIMDCGGKGMGPSRNWRFVGPGCPTMENALDLLAFWVERGMSEYIAQLRRDAAALKADIRKLQGFILETIEEVQRIEALANRLESAEGRPVDGS